MPVHRDAVRRVCARSSGPLPLSAPGGRGTNVKPYVLLDIDRQVGGSGGCDEKAKWWGLHSKVRLQVVTHPAEPIGIRGGDASHYRRVNIASLQQVALKSKISQFTFLMTTQPDSLAPRITVCVGWVGGGDKSVGGGLGGRVDGNNQVRHCNAIYRNAIHNIQIRMAIC